MDAMQITHQNPDATMPLLVPVLVLNNTHEDVVNANVRANAQRDLPWLYQAPAHDRVAIICGGGPSLQDCVHQIRDLTGDIIGLNGAAEWLSDRGFDVDTQIIIDAQAVTAGLVDPGAYRHLFASHVHPNTLGMADNPTLFHLNFDGLEDLLPPEKVARGGYSLVGGGVSVGITALVVAYVLGYRTLHLFGYDSCNRASATHAYPQPHNAMIPNIDVTWGGKTYNASMPMKLQAEAFPRFAAQLQEEGVAIHVHGDGLLPAIWAVPPMTEREKYQKAWMHPLYGRTSPGELAAPVFLDVVKPDGLVIDFGCGTGRGALAINEAGVDVLLVDFTDNCREKAAFRLPFIQWDLTAPCEASAPYGFCADVMEHIPTEDVATVLRNIFASAPRVFFQISTVPDAFGAEIGARLHLTVRTHDWWADMLARFGVIEWQDETPTFSRFYAIAKAQLTTAFPSEGTV